MDYGLSLMTFIPLVGMVLVMLTPRRWENLIRFWALAASALSFLISLALYAAFRDLPPQLQTLDPTRPNPFEEIYTWIPTIGARYHVAVDGVSLPLVVLTTLLTLVSIIYSWPVIRERVKEYYAFFLLLEVGMLGVFIALDFVLFYVFWEVSLVPMYFLIGIWGGPKREYAAIKFFLYTLVGSLAMLLAILAMYSSSQPRTFDMLLLIQQRPLEAPHVPRLVSILAFWGFFLAFAIKVPVWPFHTWLPDAHVEAPTAGSVILAGILLKMGTYGFVRVLLPMLPREAEAFWLITATLAVISIIYGALVAMAQMDFKKLVAYSSVNHMGYVMLGVAAASAVATQDEKPLGATMALNGAVLQMIAHGLITGSLFLLVGVLYDLRAHVRMLDQFGGLASQMPVYAGFLTLMCFASLGLPSLAGFVAEFLTFVGAFWVEATRFFACLGVLGVIITAAFFLWTIQRLLLGPLNERWKDLPDMKPFEEVALAPLALLTIAIGIAPNPVVLEVINTTVHAILQGMGGG